MPPWGGVGVVSLRHQGVDDDLTAAHRVESKDRPQQFRPPCADDAGQSQNLAAAQLQVDAGTRPVRSGLLVEYEVFHFQYHGAGGVRHARKQFGEAAADHLFDDVLGGESGTAPPLTPPPVAQDGKAVGHLLDFFEEMADVDHGHPAVRKRRIRSNNRRESVRVSDEVGSSKTSTRTSISRCASDFDELLETGSQFGDGGVERHLGMFQNVEGLAHTAAALGAAEEAPAGPAPGQAGRWPQR